MKIKHIILLVIFFTTFQNIFCQKEFNISIGAEIENGKNLGDITTNSEITDGYSPNNHKKSIVLSIAYKNFGVSISKYDLELKGNGFSRPYELIENTYNNFPRDWSGKGGRYHTKGYLFDGYSIGAFKTINTKYFDLELLVNYGKINVKINRHHPSNQLFSYSYNTEEDFTSRHWAIYNGGDYFSSGVNLVKNIWKGINLYSGVNYRNGSFEYIFRETVRDDLVVENNLEETLNINKRFESIGWRIGVKYIYEFGKAYD